MNGLLIDVRYAFRTFQRSPGFYSLVVAILALGIASSLSVFSLLDGILLRPLPYREPHRLVTLTSFAANPRFDSNGSLSYNDFLQLKGQARSFADLAITFRTGWSRVTLKSGTDTTALQGAFVSPNLFQLFGRAPLLGRTFSEAENRRAERVVVISDALWAERFASSPQAIGQDLLLGRDRWRVIGVMPGNFQVPFLDTQIWAPILSHPEWNDTEETNPHERARWDVLARLAPGVSLPAAQAEVDAIEKGLRAALPEFHGDLVRVIPLREHFSGSMRQPLLVLFGAVASLLCLACANVANLLLARATQRAREMAVRSALGAGRARLLRQLVTEALAFSLAGGLLGIAAAFELVPLWKHLAPANTPLLDAVSLDGRSLLFALLVCVALGVVLGLVPAWQIATQQTNESLKAAGRSLTEAPQSRRFKSILVAAEFAVAMVLLTGAGLLIRSFVAVLAVNPGFRTESVLTIGVGLPSNMPAARTAQFYREALARIATFPGVQFAGGVSNLFFLNETRTHALRQVEGHAPEAKSAWTPLVWTQVSGDYFRAIGIPLLRGRFFDDRDRPTAPPVAIVNETLARRYWPHEDPLGKRLKGFDPRGQHDDWLTVVGLVGDTHSGGLEKAPFSQIYEVQAQRGEQIGNLVVRTAANPQVLAGSLRSLLRGLSPDVTISSSATVEQLLGRQQTQRRFQTWLIAVFSACALALAALGVFAIMHYSVAARRAEIGIRMALGGNPRDMLRLILGQGSRLAVSGILVGSVVALGLTQSIAGLLFHVPPADPLSFASAALLLLLVALGASLVPALAASHVNPLSAMRQE